MYVIVGEAEEMLSEALTFTHKAAMAGVHVRLEVWPKMIHNFPLWHAILPERKDAIKKAGEFMVFPLHLFSHYRECISEPKLNLSQIKKPRIVRRGGLNVFTTE